MTTFFDAFVSGQLDPALTHVTLLGGSILAEFAVAAGIVLESPKEKTLREWAGMGLVLGGVFVSAIFTIALFVFDEGISNRQERELAEIRLPRQLNVKEFQEKLMPLPKRQFEVLYDGATPDAATLANSIFVSLLQAGWGRSQKLPEPLGPRTGPPELRDIFLSLPLTQQAGGGPWGLSVVSADPPNGDIDSVEFGLVRALEASVIGPPSVVSWGTANDVPRGTIRIIVGPKLP